MRPSFVMGNWKMNGCIDSIKDLLHAVCDNLPKQSNVHCVVFPPALYLPLVQSLLTQSPIKWGAQNVYPKDAGAFTGEYSGPMLTDFGCRYVLVGHSERRRSFHEDEKFVAEKFHHVKDHGMIPVLCVGETLEERKKGLTEQVLIQQLSAVCQKGSDVFQGAIVAYEPVWAIGTGQTATPEQVQVMHQFIRHFVSSVDAEDAKKIPILYGGSVNEKNARQLFEIPDVDGGLIGGASLHAQQFLEIATCIN